MLEDSVVRDSMKIFVKGLLLKIEDNLRSQVKIKDDFLEDEEELMRIKQEQGGITNTINDPNVDEEEKQRVDKLLKEYHQNNPLIKLNFFKNKVKIPFSFTTIQRGSNRNRVVVATLYVGSEICILNKIYLNISWRRRRQKYKNSQI
jgi:hypothetical protein